MNPYVKPLLDNIGRHLVACDAEAVLLVTGLLAGGHVLVQGAPGLGKTTLARVLAQSVDCSFRRIQFTPDLLPADILGYSLYDPGAGRFTFHKGPVFGHMILADEINRAGPRVQSALLEAMNEHQVSMDGETYRLDRPFFVVATENHLGSAGTFPLPDSQLDRFLLSFVMKQPDPEAQVEILALHAGGVPDGVVQSVLTRGQLVEMQDAVRRVHVGRNVVRYIGDLCAAVLARQEWVGGPSPRAAIGLMRAAQALAYLHNRDAVLPDHVKELVCSVFRHRLMLRGQVSRGITRVEALLNEIVEQTVVPVQVA